MPALRSPRFPTVAMRSLAALLLSACSGSRAATTGTPPKAEFLLSSADSTFWVTTATGQARVRGVPLMLAHYDGHFYELYTSDEDFSYEDALLLGERLYRRDLLTGDSTIVFADTAVAPVARAYARAHPDQRPLGPDDEGATQPRTTATAEVDVIDVSGPYVSYEYHVDIDLPTARPWHATRRGVIDLRTGKPATLADLFGPAAGARVALRGRTTFDATRDSVVRSASATDAERRAAAAFEALQFDERSFALSSLDGNLAVTFAIPGRGPGAAGNIVSLDAMKLDSVSWWSPLMTGIARDGHDGDGDVDSWSGAGYRVLARYDSMGDAARVALVDAAKHEWSIGTVLAPIHRIDWLDQPRIGDDDRKALTRAFNQAARYDESAQSALRDNASSPSAFQFISRSTRPHASHQDRSRKPARNVRAHDAGERQQHGARVRGRGAVHDGQDGGHRRVPS
jgi:hypothetical protein